MQINNNSSVNFHGYKNLITNSAKTSRNEGYSFLSMQLDNVGKNDLDLWKNFQQKLFEEKKPSDILTIQLFQAFGDHMIHLGNNCIDPNLYSEEPEKEMSLMKSYTWLANLTKRIMNDNKLINNRDLYKVFQASFANLLPVMGNNISFANQFVLESQSPENHPQETALDINENIDKIMQNYLLEE